MVRATLRATTAALALLVLTPAAGRADCSCRCVDGQVMPVCDSALEPRLVCAPRICPTPPPSVPPIVTEPLPPIWTEECSPMQVYDASTGMHRWQMVCR